MTVQITMTPTQQRMNQVLDDYKSHLREDLVACLWDEQSAPSAIQAHISGLRKVLAYIGEEIICEISGRRITYRKAKIPKDQ